MFKIFSSEKRKLAACSTQTIWQHFHILPLPSHSAHAAVACDAGVPVLSICLMKQIIDYFLSWLLEYGRWSRCERALCWLLNSALALKFNLQSPIIHTFVSTHSCDIIICAMGCVCWIKRCKQVCIFNFVWKSVLFTECQAFPFIHSFVRLLVRSYVLKCGKHQLCQEN